MTISFEFEPVVGRAHAMNARMFRELASSLRHVADVVGSNQQFDVTGLIELCERLEQGLPHDPVVYAYYYKLVEALMTDDHSLARTLLRKITAVTLMPSNEIIALGPELGTERSTLYISLIEEEEPLRLDVAAPNAEAVIAFLPDFVTAKGLISTVAPALADEINGLARQIILVGQAPTRESVFDGGSHFQLWNALFLNIDRFRSKVALAGVIAHECAHSLLFGYCIDEALTCNPDDAVYISPLRDDLRPMDGIYHATFVSARMYWLLSRLVVSGILDSEDRLEAIGFLERDRRNFEEGYAVVEEHGILTETGKRVMAGARAYMDTACAPPADLQQNFARAAT